MTMIAATRCLVMTVKARSLIAASLASHPNAKEHLVMPASAHRREASTPVRESGTDGDVDEATGLFPDGCGQARCACPMPETAMLTGSRIALAFQIPEPDPLPRENAWMPAVGVHQVLHGLTRPGDLPLRKSTRGQKRRVCC